MNGIEKITQRIDADAQAEIDRITAEAREQAGQITAKYQAQAARETADRRARNEKNAAQREERLVSVAELEARKRNLAARQSMVEEAFDLALKKLCSMPDSAYVETTARLMAKAAPDGCGTAVFSREKHDSVGAAAVAAANRLLGSKGKLTISDEVRPIQGGFILVNGSVEVNCTFETLVRLQRGSMAGEAARRLFPES